jgi:hypothetical protein
MSNGPKVSNVNDTGFGECQRRELYIQYFGSRWCKEIEDEIIKEGSQPGGKGSFNKSSADERNYSRKNTCGPRRNSNISRPKQFKRLLGNFYQNMYIRGVNGFRYYETKINHIFFGFYVIIILFIIILLLIICILVNFLIIMNKI